MKLYLATRLMSASALALVVLMIAPAYAAEEVTDAVTAEEPRKKPPQHSPRSARNAELKRCKQEARGMRGPERGSFMTECLAGDRNEK